MTRLEVRNAIAELRDKQLAAWPENDRYFVAAALAYLESSIVIGTTEELADIMAKSNQSSLDARLKAEQNGS